MRFLAVLLLCVTSLAAQAKPSPNFMETYFSGDRYASRAVAQASADTLRAIPRKAARHHKGKRKTVPRPAPGYVADAPITAWGGLKREVAQVIGGRPAAWCGWWLGHHMGMPLRHLWLARNWASVGANAGAPQIGVVVVWRHHVGIITGRQGNQWVVKSGNDGRRVRERPRSVAGAIAFRRV